MAAIANLPHLHTLDVLGGRIGPECFKLFFDAPLLDTLHVSAHNFAKIDIDIVEKLYCLKSLNVAQISSADLESIAMLPSLEHLSILEGEYSQNSADLIGRMTSLQTLSVDDSLLPTDGSLGNLRDLETLSVSRYAFTDQQCEDISNLKGLKELTIFEHTQVTNKETRALARLSNLLILNLNDTMPGEEGMRAICTIKSLQKLYISDSDTGKSGMATSGNLKQLQLLSLSRSYVEDRGAVAIAELPALQTLYLDECGVGDEGAFALARMNGLRTLELSGNVIGMPGCRAILDAWAHPEHAAGRQVLNLSGNPGAEQLLPAEVLRQTDAQALLAAWRRFREGSGRPLNEAKLIVVGKGNVGKTSLIRYLKTGESRNPAEPATEGVRAYERIETAQWTPNGSPFTLNIWDFGGQEIYYGTHRYFLTARSLYLLVLDDRTDGPSDAEDWLRRIRSHAAAAPVIVVVNKAGEGGPGLRLDEDGLMERHGPIVAVLRTSCNPGNDERILALKARIVATLADIGLMPDVHQGYPEPWWQVKDALAAQARDARFVDVYSFRRLCEANGIVEENEQRGLLRTLHELGTVVTHGLEPEARAVHRETTLLDPNWLTQAIYAILGSALVRDQNGEFTLSDVGNLLDREVYPERLHGNRPLGAAFCGAA